VLGGLTFLCTVFLCVLLHEFGHALTARLFGIQTFDITLLPIGGLARLERIPRNPWQEFWIAIAGPAVNVAIVAALLPFSAALNSVRELLPTNVAAAGFLTQLISINVTLVVFNLLPAFPLDGGRVLRSVLAMFLPYTRATNIAAACGQVMAVLFGIVGFFTNWMLMLVAFFVYVAARNEARHVQRESLPYDMPEPYAGYGRASDYMPLHERTIKTPNGDLWVVWVANDTPVSPRAAEAARSMERGER
jgi:Zn-dependent protease